MQKGGSSVEDLRTRVAYLHGLVEGLDIEDGSAQGRVLAEMVSVLGEMAEALDDVADAQDELADYIDEVDEDLTDLAGDVYMEADDENEDEEYEDGTTELHCPSCGQLLALGTGDLTDGGRNVNVVCPNCGTMVGIVARAHDDD